jgi:hypothetical protein
MKGWVSSTRPGRASPPASVSATARPPPPRLRVAAPPDSEPANSVDRGRSRPAAPTPADVRITTWALAGLLPLLLPVVPVPMLGMGGLGWDTWGLADARGGSGLTVVATRMLLVTRERGALAGPGEAKSDDTAVAAVAVCPAARGWPPEATRRAVLPRSLVSTAEYARGRGRPPGSSAAASGTGTGTGKGDGIATGGSTAAFFFFLPLRLLSFLLRVPVWLSSSAAAAAAAGAGGAACALRRRTGGGCSTGTVGGPPSCLHPSSMLFSAIDHDRDATVSAHVR